MIIPMYTPNLPYQSADRESLAVLYILVPSHILSVAMTPIGVSKVIFNLLCYHKVTAMPILLKTTNICKAVMMFWPPSGCHEVLK